MFHWKEVIEKKKKKNNLSIAVIILYARKGNIYPAYVS